MGTRGLQAALDRGEPLADFSIHFRDGLDYVALTDQINQIADDFDLHLEPWYGDARTRIGSATHGALLRLFGWKLDRVSVPGNPRDYMWRAVTGPTLYPAIMDGAIESIGLSQPGADDKGQLYDYGQPWHRHWRRLLKLHVPSSQGSP